MVVPRKQHAFYVPDPANSRAPRTNLLVPTTLAFGFWFCIRSLDSDAALHCNAIAPHGWVVGCGLWVVGCGLRVIGRKWPPIIRLSFDVRCSMFVVCCWWP